MQPILDLLEQRMESHADKLETWLKARRAEHTPYLYNSVDLRHSGGRLVPVDTNLYPAGFNNLSEAGVGRAIKRAGKYIREAYPESKNVLILPESHTRNLAYLDNLVVLNRILSEAGFEVKIASLIAKQDEVIKLESLSGTKLEQHGVTRKGDRLVTDDGFEADVIVLNNDLTAGTPDIIKDLAQPMLPPPNMGWHSRRKSRHFAAYRALITSFCEEMELDPWLISAIFRCCTNIHFKQREGLDCLATQVDEVLAEIKVKYKEYGISDDPYVYIKADQGTYGMGIMLVKSGSEILEINKKQRNKMEVVKEGSHVTNVIIQEGVPTEDEVNGSPAEPMVYLMDGMPVGGMYRVNPNRDRFGNLNAAGVQFIGMCDEWESAGETFAKVEGCRFQAYGMVATLAALAVPREEKVAAALPNCAETPRKAL